MKKIFSLFLTALTFLTINGVLFNEKQGFDPANITQNLPFNEQWEVGEVVTIQDLIFNQQYSYLAQGKQAFAFESEDQQYVIKFLKTRRVRDKKWFCYWQNWFKFSTPLPIIKHFTRKKELAELCSRFVLAYSELPQETALLYVHMNRTNGLFKTLTVVDGKGKRHEIALDQVPFVVQRKVQLAPDRIQQLLTKNDLEGAKQAIRALKDLFAARTFKGFTDERQVFSKNYGFINGQAVQIDIGKITKIDPSQYSEEFSRICLNLHQWIGRHYEKLNETD